MLKCTSKISKFTSLIGCLRTSLTFPGLHGSYLSIQRSFTLPGVHYGNFFDDIIEALLSESFFTRKMKKLSRPDRFKLYGKMGVDFFSTSELLYANMKIRLLLIRARPKFYLVSDKHNVTLGIVDCSFYSCRFAFKDGYHKKRMDMLVYTFVKFDYLETIAKIFIIPAR